jgi:hypothetical protein
VTRQVESRKVCGKKAEGSRWRKPFFRREDRDCTWLSATGRFRFGSLKFGKGNQADLNEDSGESKMRGKHCKKRLRPNTYA